MVVTKQDAISAAANWNKSPHRDKGFVYYAVEERIGWRIAVSKRTPELSNWIRRQKYKFDKARAID